MHRGIATFTLDSGTCPKWLFERMVKLGREMTEILVTEFGPDEFIKRIGDPTWFQSLGTVLAFDWNASGLTTILTAALKESIRGAEKDLGVFICGGKGKTSLKTPDQIKDWGSKMNLNDKHVDNLVYNSKMSAKVDSSLVQDGYTLYHHSFFFSKNGAWTVVQQGMNTKTTTARRYHWHSANAKDLVCEPHSGISSQKTGNNILDLSAKNSDKTRDLSTELTNGNYFALMKDIQLLRKYSTPQSQVLSAKVGPDQLTLLNLTDEEFFHHPVVNENFSQSKYLEKILYLLCDHKPKNYENLVAQKGVGPKTVRALSLVSEVIYGAKPSYEDPARYSFAHGGKDHIPYPVDRKTYDQTIAILKKAVLKTKLNQTEKNKALKRLGEN